MATPIRTFITAGALGFMLAVAGCSKAEQQKSDVASPAATGDVKSGSQAAGEQVKADASKLGEDVKESAKKTGADLKAISKDPEVKKAAHELEGSLKDLGKAVKDASKKEKSETNTSSPEAAKK